MQSTRVSLKRLRNLSSKVSAHYLIDRNGKVINLVKQRKLLGMLENPSGLVLIT